jgi:hypothetical protein
MIARIVARERMQPTADDPRVIRVCLDVLAAKATVTQREDRSQFAATLLRLLHSHCPADAADDLAACAAGGRP